MKNFIHLLAHLFNINEGKFFQYETHSLGEVKKFGSFKCSKCGNIYNSFRTDK